MKNQLLQFGVSILYLFIVLLICQEIFAKDFCLPIVLCLCIVHEIAFSNRTYSNESWRFFRQVKPK